MNELTYTTSDGKAISLVSDDLSVQTAQEIRGYEWEFGVGRKNIYAPRRTYSTHKVKFIAKREELDKLRKLTDRDVVNESPGTFTAQDTWQQKGYITGITIDTVSPYYIFGSFDVILLQGAWYKAVSVSYFKNSKLNSAVNYGKDYPFDYKYDYGYNRTPQLLNIGSHLSCEFRMIIYGSCVNPVITIGENAYRVNVRVPENSLLIIDTRDKTVTLRDDTGYTQNVFDKAVRGSGKGSKEYIFEPLQPGEHIVSWDNSYGFDIEYYIEESCIPWIDTY